MFTTIFALALSMPVVAPVDFQRGCPEEASAYQYKTINRGWRGEFRDDGNDDSWTENTDRRAGGLRTWHRDEAERRCVIRLRDGDAIIDIDTRTGFIWYTDPNYRGYPRFTKLYEVTGVE